MTTAFEAYTKAAEICEADEWVSGRVLAARILALRDALEWNCKERRHTIDTAIGVDDRRSTASTRSKT